MHVRFTRFTVQLVFKEGRTRQSRNKAILLLIGPFRIINGPLINADRCIINILLAQVLHSLMPFAPNLLPSLFLSRLVFLPR